MDNLHTTTGVKVVNLSAVRKNWQMLANLSKGAECGAVVKANAYGCGVEQISLALIKQGCKSFFVATLQEAIELRSLNKKIRIFCFAGLDKYSQDYFLRHNIIPVLNSLLEIELYDEFAREKNRKLKCAIHVDTGMNRLGVHVDQCWLASAICGSLKVELLMTHFACADNLASKKTSAQNKLFKQASKFFDYIKPSVKLSAANSAAILQRKNYCYDLTRPGTAIYGGEAIVGKKNPMQVVVSLYGKIIKIRTCEKGDTIGYGATQKVVSKSMKIAYVGVGYADGYVRSVSNSGVAARKIAKPPQGFFKGKYLNGVGRISMDMCGFDISKIDESEIYTGDYIELIGENVPLETVAKSAGTIGYEMLTELGNRCAVVYK